jgi:hypothetical protein
MIDLMMAYEFQTETGSQFSDTVKHRCVKDSLSLYSLGKKMFVPKSFRKINTVCEKNAVFKGCIR